MSMVRERRRAFTAVLAASALAFSVAVAFALPAAADGAESAIEIEVDDGMEAAIEIELGGEDAGDSHVDDGDVDDGPVVNEEKLTDAEAAVEGDAGVAAASFAAPESAAQALSAITDEEEEVPELAKITVTLQHEGTQTPVADALLYLCSESRGTCIANVETDKSGFADMLDRGVVGEWFQIWVYGPDPETHTAGPVWTERFFVDSPQIDLALYVDVKGLVSPVTKTAALIVNVVDKAG